MVLGSVVVLPVVFSVTPVLVSPALLSPEVRAVSRFVALLEVVRVALPIAELVRVVAWNAGVPGMANRTPGLGTTKSARIIVVPPL